MKNQSNLLQCFRMGITVILVILMMSMLSSCMLVPREDELPAPAIVEVQEASFVTHTVTRKDISDTIHGYAMLEAVNEVDVLAGDAPTPLKVIYKNYGDYVKKGDLLAQLEQENLQKNIDAKKDALKREQLAYELLQLEYNELLRKENEAKEMLRYAVDPDDKEAAELRVKQASAQKELKAIDKEAKQVDINQIREQLAELEKHLSETNIYAPVDGRIIYVRSQSGRPGAEVVIPQEIMFTIQDLSTLCIRYKPDDPTELKRYEVGMKVPVTMKGKTYEGEISYIYNDREPPEVKRLEGCLLISLNDIPEDVGIGELVQFSVVFETRKDVIVIPKSAIRRYLDRTYVQVLTDDDRKLEVDIEIGLENAIEAEIVNGLAEGDEIILK